MMIRSAPPASANLAEIPVPAPAPMIGRPPSIWAHSRARTSFLEYRIVRPPPLFTRMPGHDVRHRAPLAGLRGALIDEFDQQVDRAIGEGRVVDVEVELFDSDVGPQVLPDRGEAGSVRHRVPEGLSGAVEHRYTAERQQHGDPSRRRVRS